MPGVQLCGPPLPHAGRGANARRYDGGAAERVALQKGCGGTPRRRVAAPGAAVGAQGVPRRALAAVLATQVLRRHRLLLHEGLQAGFGLQGSGL